MTTSAARAVPVVGLCVAGAIRRARRPTGAAGQLGRRPGRSRSSGCAWQERSDGRGGPREPQGSSVGGQGGPGRRAVRGRSDPTGAGGPREPQGSSVGGQGGPGRRAARGRSDPTGAAAHGSRRAARSAARAVPVVGLCVAGAIRRARRPTGAAGQLGRRPGRSRSSGCAWQERSDGRGGRAVRTGPEALTSRTE